MKSATASILALSVTVFAGCQRGNPAISDSGVASTEAGPNDAIRTAIQAHLAHNGNLNLKSFDTEIKQVTFAGDRAQAQVEFHVKSGTGMMQLTYALQKRDGAWSVVESTPDSSNFSHPALDKSQVPTSSGVTAGEPAVFRALDNFHRGATTPQQTLPPGHPRVVAAP